MKDSDHLLRIKDVKELTSLATSTINLWVAHGKFPKPLALSATIKVWRRKDLIDWIDKQVEAKAETVKPVAPAAELRLVNS